INKNFGYKLSYVRYNYRYNELDNSRGFTAKKGGEMVNMPINSWRYHYGVTFGKLLLNTCYLPPTLCEFWEWSAR
ncbi:MAG: hypothetical protein LBF27_08290, partial [Sphingobacterium sp.]|nr:hypothetical protein [Sphingobacterium sp.]